MTVEEQIEALAQALSSMPGLKNHGERVGIAAPARRLWAAELIEKWGVSIDPGKATVEVVSDNPPQMGNHGPHGLIDRSPAAEKAGREELRRGAQDFVNTNMGDLGARIAAADTEEKRAALREELRRTIPPQILAVVQANAGVQP